MRGCVLTGDSKVTVLCVEARDYSQSALFASCIQIVNNLKYQEQDEEQEGSGSVLGLSVVWFVFIANNVTLGQRGCSSLKVINTLQEILKIQYQ